MYFCHRKRRRNGDCNMRISFCGDISVSDRAELFAKQDVSALFNDIPKAFAGSDRVIANLECAVTDKETAIKKFGPPLKGPFGTVEVLKKIGVTDCALSNNHIFDYGKAGLKDTISELEKNGIGYTGIGENEIDARRDMVIEFGGKKISIVNACEHEFSYALEDRVGARAFDPFETADDIAKAKQTSDFVVLILHGGKEFCEYPSTRLVKLCRSMVRRGADLVLCQHTHCISCYEEFEGGHILYGQGNFHFIKSSYSTTRPTWNEGLIVHADFGDDCKVEFVPVIVEGPGIRLANSEESARMLSGMDERSKTLVDGSYKEKFAEFANDPKQEYYRFLEKYVPADQMDKFAHYLDCEAHTDIWKELYKTYNATNERDFVKPTTPRKRSDGQTAISNEL